jgi:hypothetical protein
LPVVFSVNCASGKYDDPTPNFAEQILQLSGGGAVGLIGDSRDSPSWANSHLARGMFDAIFPNVMPAYGSATPIKRMGDVLNSAKIYLDTQNGIDGQSATDTIAEHYLYTYFGDPSMQIWTHQPPTFILSRVAIALLENGILLTVTQEGTEGAAATLLRAGMPVGRALVVNGQALIPFPPPPKPTSRTAADVAPLTLSLDKNGFIATEVPLQRAMTSR